MINIQTLLRYLKGHDFRLALMMTSTMVLAGVTLHFTNHSDKIIGVLIGILLISFCDLQGSSKHRLLAMVLSTVLNFLIVIGVNLLVGNIVMLFTLIAVITFLLSFLAIYGNRGGLFAFSGLLGLVLSMVKMYEGIEILTHALTIAIGGLLFIIASSIFHWFTKRNQIQQQLGELSQLTAKYLHLQLENSEHKLSNETSLMNLQKQIIEQQDQLRTMIFTDRVQNGIANIRYKQMLILVELIDIMELSVANNSIITRAKKSILPEKFYLLQPFTLALQQVVHQLNITSKLLLDGRSLPNNVNIKQHLNIANYTIDDYVTLVGLPKARKGALALRNLHDYIEKQANNLLSIERLLTNDEQLHQKLSQQQQLRFLPKESYSFDTFINNLSIKSPIFRHSLRLTIAIVFGYLISLIAKVENPYWVMLTIIVIMRPNYGLTKSRSVKRILGTLIGVAIATILVILVDNHYFNLIMAIITMIIAYSLLNRNYILATCFITLNIIFAFSLLQPNIWTVIQFRFIDTLIGTGVSLAVGYFIMPFWEHKTIHTTIANAIEKSNLYLQEITQNYLQPEQENLNYRLSRKEAFIATSQLTSSFQRQTQDPKSKQKNLNTYYEVVSIHQLILSTLANLGSYIQNHHIANLTTEFKIITHRISKQLKQIELQVRTKEATQLQPIRLQQDILNAQQAMNEHWELLETHRNKEIQQGKTTIDDRLRLQLQEVRFIEEELNWLLELTENLQKASLDIFNSER